MNFSYTGFAYLCAFFAIGLMSYRFFQYWRYEKTTTSQLFFYITFLASVFVLSVAIAGLFFAANSQILRWVVVFSIFVQSFIFALFAYLIFYLKLPTLSPWFGFFVVLIPGLLAAGLAANTPFQPFLDSGLAIDWDFRPLLTVNIIRAVVSLVSFIPFVVILLLQIKSSQDLFVKSKAAGLLVAIIFGLALGVIEFLLEEVLKLKPISSDIATIILSIIVFMVVILAQKPPAKIEAKKEKVLSPEGPQISW